MTRREMLESVPHLNSQVRWEHLESGEVMAVYEQERRGFRKLFARVLATPAVAQVLLDDVGTKVVGAIDGVRTVQELIGFVADEFRLSRKEAEVSLLKYLEMLGQRRLVGFETRPEEE